MARVADILVDSLISQGADLAFGVPGESFLAVLDAFYDRQEGFRFITNRHEGGAGFMAEAYGKLTGKPGLCFVTRGPGATNAAIAVHTARQNSTPMIMFVGQIQSGDRDREAFQELDYRQVFAGLAKWVTELDNPNRTSEIIRRAYNIALSGRPGPVVVALPENVLRMETVSLVAKKVEFPVPRANAPDLSRACDLYLASSNPLIVVGGGGWTSADRAAVKRFTKRDNTPIIAAFRCQDLVDHTSQNYVGDAGVGMPSSSYRALKECDLLIAVNVRFGEMLTDAWSLLEDRKEMPKLVHLHREAGEVNKVYHADIALCGVPEDILNAFPSHPAAENWALKHREDFLELRKKPTISALSMANLCAILNESLPSDAVITNGAGNFAAWPSRHIDFGKGRRLLAPQSGAMGFGVPASIAAKIESPKRHILCFAGDGDFQMTANELATAAQYNARPNILILNNRSLGTIAMHQNRDYPKRVSGTELVNPDFQRIAQSCGFDFIRLDASEKLDNAASRLVSEQGLIVEITEYG
ncbi:MAG: thiamine pyrophosphate-binding protein [Pseudomonadota bacterium]